MFPSGRSLSKPSIKPGCKRGETVNRRSGRIKLLVAKHPPNIVNSNFLSATEGENENAISSYLPGGNNSFNHRAVDRHSRVCWWGSREWDAGELYRRRILYGAGGRRNSYIQLRH